MLSVLHYSRSHSPTSSLHWFRLVSSQGRMAWLIQWCYRIMEGKRSNKTSDPALSWQTRVQFSTISEDEFPFSGFSIYELWWKDLLTRSRWVCSLLIQLLYLGMELQILNVIKIMISNSVCNFLIPTVACCIRVIFCFDAVTKTSVVRCGFLLHHQQ